MTRIAAAIARTDVDVTPVVSTMMQAMRGRGAEEFRICFPGLARETTLASGLAPTGSSCVLGAVNSNSLFDDQSQPIQDEGCCIVLDGRLKHSCSLPDVVHLAELVRGHPWRGLQAILMHEQGAYTAAVSSRGKLMCARDSLGTVPAYFGETSEFFAVATEKKALWEVGARSVGPLPPGHIVEVSSKGMDSAPVNLLRLPELCGLSMSRLLRMLESVVRDVFDNAFRKVDRVAIGFSGGLDSSLAAYFADQSGVDVELICVGLERSEDLTVSQEAAEAMGIPFVAEAHSDDDIEKTLNEAIFLAEDPDPLQIEIAIPLLWVAKAAAERGHRRLGLGQGCDELFGGYQKYQNEFSASGSNSTRNMMFADILSTSERNLSRDNKVVTSQGLELELPFLSRTLVELALSIPLEYKLAVGADSERKIVLRELARAVGLPRDIVHRKKHAIQYSTGVSQALHRLAKSRGVSLAQLTNQRFSDVFHRNG